MSKSTLLLVLEILLQWDYLSNKRVSGTYNFSQMTALLARHVRYAATVPLEQDTESFIGFCLNVPF